MNADRRLFLRILPCLGFLWSTARGGQASRPSAEITEVRAVGISAANAGNSIVQVGWRAADQPRGFDVSIEITYADNAAERTRTSVSGTARTCRFEIPSVHKAPGRPAAEMKFFTVTISSADGELARRKGSL